MQGPVTERARRCFVAAGVGAGVELGEEETNEGEGEEAAEVSMAEDVDMEEGSSVVLELLVSIESWPARSVEVPAVDGVGQVHFFAEGVCFRRLAILDLCQGKVEAS